MKKPIALETISENTVFTEGDVFVLFGELFGRGYATGLLDQAKKAGMKIVGITVGRRDENNALRPLTSEELSEAEAAAGWNDHQCSPHGRLRSGCASRWPYANRSSVRADTGKLGA